MNLAQTRKSIKNLNKIKDIIEVSKFATLQELSKTSKITNTALEFSVVAKEIFKKASEKYNINSKYYKTQMGGHVLWMYITNKKSLLSPSSTVQEKLILENFNKKRDRIICVGDEAIEFAQKNELSVVMQLKTDKHGENKIASTISALYENNDFSSVQCVYAGISKPTIILPMANANIDSSYTINISTKSKFFPSLQGSMKIIAHMYVLRVISVIISQSKYFEIKEKLLRHEESIKSVESRIDKKRTTSIKWDRKTQTEELILITGNARRSKKKVSHE